MNKILIKNLPNEEFKSHTINVKPYNFLYVLMACGFMLLFGSKIHILMGIILMLFCCFALIFLPDRKLVEFRDDYLVLYNQRNRNECLMIDYDEIVSWTYRMHYPYDTVYIELVDGRVEMCDMFSKHVIKKLFNVYMPDKERSGKRYE